MNLDNDLLLRIAEWKPAIDGWPDDGGQSESLACYHPLIQAIESLPLQVRHDDGHEYGDTFFGLFLYKPECDEWFEGVGIYIALSRFAPIGIYGEERRAWGLDKKRKRKPRPGTPSCVGYGGFPSLGNVYSIPNPALRIFTEDLQRIMKDHNVYLPSIEQLTAPITFTIPEIFAVNANLGSSLVFHILFNDLY